MNGKGDVRTGCGHAKTLYTTGQAANQRDVVAGMAHFANPIAADGKVFFGAQANLVTYGLLGAAKF